MKNKKSNVEEAYNYIKNKILNMEYRPGFIISENSLSKEIKMSRTPIREALKRLEMEGLITTLSSRRKQVFILTIKDVEQIFDIKKSLECSIAKWAAERGKEEDFKKLREVVMTMERIVKAKILNSNDKNFELWLEKDNEYHDLLFKMADNERAEQIIKNLNAQWHRLRVGILAMEDRIQTSLKEHKEIAEAIINREPYKAEELMRDHLENLERLIINLMKIFNFPSF